MLICHCKQLSLFIVAVSNVLFLSVNVLVLRFYMIHLFLFDHSTCCEMTRNVARAPELCHDSIRTMEMMKNGLSWAEPTVTEINQII